MAATPARGRHRFPATKRRRVSYNVPLEGFRYAHGVALTQEGSRWVVMGSGIKETYVDHLSAQTRYAQLVKINRLAGL
jgi:hypothetical protein